MAASNSQKCICSHCGIEFLVAELGMEAQNSDGMVMQGMETSAREDAAVDHEAMVDHEVVVHYKTAVHHKAAAHHNNVPIHHKAAAHHDNAPIHHKAAAHHNNAPIHHKAVRHNKAAVHHKSVAHHRAASVHKGFTYVILACCAIVAAVVAFFVAWNFTAISGGAGGGLTHGLTGGADGGDVGATYVNSNGYGGVNDGIYNNEGSGDAEYNNGGSENLASGHQSSGGPLGESPYYVVDISVELYPFRVTVAEIFIFEYEDLTPALGNKFVGINLTFENTSEEPRWVLYSQVAVQVEGITMPESTLASVHIHLNRGTNFLSGNLAGGRALRGHYAVEVPIGTTVMDLWLNCGTFPAAARQNERLTINVPTWGEA